MEYYSIDTFVSKIVEEIKKDFATIHLSGNLMETITSYKLSENEAIIEIPAPRYDIDTFLRTQTIVYTGDGSYAEEVNEMGGFSKTHKGYVERAIMLAIMQIASIYKVKEITNGNG